MAGAGPWGLATAWRLLEAGARVVVLDDGEAPAAHVAAGMLGARSEAVEDERDMYWVLRAAGEAWPGFAARLEAAAGVDPGYRRTGAVLAAVRPEHLAQVRHRARTLADWGDPAAWIDGESLRDLDPGLGPATLGGLHLPEEHQAEPRALLRALRAAVRAGGGRIVEAPAAELIRKGGAIAGVRDADGTEHRAGHVVVAAGHAGGRLAPAVPVRPVKGQILRLRAVPGAPVPIGHTIRTPGVYLAPRDGEVVVGATNEERGDRHATAIAVAELLEEALRAVPDLAELALAEVATGLRPAAADGRPVLGPAGPGVTFAGGGYRNGIALTPLASAAAADIALGREAPEWCVPHSPTRFGRS